MPAYEVIDIPSHQPALVARVRHTAPDRANGALPVLFVHGSSFPSGLSFDFRMDGQSWMDWMAARGYDVYALDFLGYGLSDRYAAGPAGRAREVARDVGSAVDAILRRTGQRQVLLVGHSWGGSVAARYAQDSAGKVAKLVLFAAVTPRGDGAPHGAAVPAYEEMTPAQRIAAMDGLRPQEAQPQLHPDVFARWGAQWLASDGRSECKVRFPSGPSADIADLLRGASYYDPARLSMPVLLVRGEWDAWPGDEDFRRLQRQVPGAQYVVIPRGTHVMHLEAARTELYQAVRAFLD
ncbi:alpha/beta fold hydrolase [Pseudoduganella sp. OTU4001]|uniref:alpha/beta fold hydrolase n=1 Tax=Pseudoduganella sp. OTU4001 TaxID=3043854 RepID=UPI00313C0ECC